MTVSTPDDSQLDHALARLVTHHEGASGTFLDSRHGSEIFPNYIKQLSSISEESSPFLL